MDNIFSSRYFVKSDAFMDNFCIGDNTIEIKKRGWWSRIYEYQWMKDICENYFKDINSRSVIDVATGNQHPGMFILKESGFKRVVGSDMFNASEYLYSKFMKEGMEYVIDDMTETKIEEKFDCVTCISVLEHIHPNVQDDALKNMISFVKEKGIIILTFDMPGFEYPTNLSLYTKVLEKNGFLVDLVDSQGEKVSTMNGEYVDDKLKQMNLTCYRIFARR